MCTMIEHGCGGRGCSWWPGVHGGRGLLGDRVGAATDMVEAWRLMEAQGEQGVAMADAVAHRGHMGVWLPR